MKNEKMNTLWKIINEIRRIMLVPWVKFYFLLNGVQWGKGWMIYGCPILQKHHKSAISIGEKFCMRNFLGSNPLGPNRKGIISTRKSGAIIEIGNCVGITGGTICAENKIQIGNHVLIGANCLIADTDFHPIESEARKHCINAGESAPIAIEDDVFIGANCIILKGVRIGKGACVGAGSVVTKDIPPSVLCAGNPAKIIRTLT